MLCAVATSRILNAIESAPLAPPIGAPWVENLRAELTEAYARSLEATAQAGLAIGGGELDTAERSARTLVKESPYRESGYRLLMEALARRDNIAEALNVYEGLRQRLRTELGTSPSASTKDLHRKLLADPNNRPETEAAAQEQGMHLEVVKLPEAKHGFVLLPKRWVVERSFAWTSRFRRLARDYERMQETLAAMHFAVFAILMLNKAAPLLKST